MTNFPLINCTFGGAEKGDISKHAKNLERFNVKGERKM